MKVSSLPMLQCHSCADDLGWLSALDLARLIRGKEVSPVEVMSALSARIDALNPRLNADRTVAAEEASDLATAAEIGVLTPAIRSGRCTACPCPSRTFSSPGGCAPPRARNCWWTTCRRRTRWRWSASAARAPSSWARPIPPNSVTRASPTARFRPHPQSVEPGAHRGRLERRGRARRWRQVWDRWRWGQTAAGPSASLPPSAGSMASSRPSDACPRGRACRAGKRSPTRDR